MVVRPLHSLCVLAKCFLFFLEDLNSTTVTISHKTCLVTAVLTMQAVMEISGLDQYAQF